jgi:ATP-dependent Lhr-like helicase
VLSHFHPTLCRWFSEAFESPTPAQAAAWPVIASGQNTLLLAPTGSGKTLAAFLVAINRIMFPPDDAPAEPGVRVLYISPLKALGVDVERNLRSPMAGVRAAAQRDGTEHHEPVVGVRSGDTPAAERYRLSRQPPDILITTPESLYLILTSQARKILQTVETVIVDEIHSLVGSKRGSHLFVSLERLERLRRGEDAGCRPLQRIGLSATQRPLEEVARLLGGAAVSDDPDARPQPRPVRIVEAGRRKQLDLRIEVPVEDMARLAEPQLESGNAAAGPTVPSIWPAIHPRLVQLIRQHRSTMLFVNSRRLAERLASSINEVAEEEIALAHHGSIAKDTRLQIEDRLKRGQLPAIVATSSLELGIDMGAVDLVIQIEAPPSIASGIQRIGRSGHQVGARSSGVVFPKYRGDLLACSAAARRMTDGQV